MADAAWIVTDRLLDFLKKRLDDPHIEDMMGGGAVYYPTIVWELGSTLQRPGHPPEQFPPRYGLSLMKDKQAEGYVSISNPEFDVILFLPKKDDETSERRIIDFDGRDIVVR